MSRAPGVWLVCRRCGAGTRWRPWDDRRGRRQYLNWSRGDGALAVVSSASLRWLPDEGAYQAMPVTLACPEHGELPVARAAVLAAVAEWERHPERAVTVRC